ncbi:MAG: hypothetical protein DMG08_29715 [Acidobacteria bacterium]|nr:MAG: hypothetical protein DMG08_29715 [Acidobacteriota bacterium]
MNSCFPYKIFAALLWSAQACLRFKGDGTFHPHQSGSKLPHSKELSGVLFYFWLRLGCFVEFVASKNATNSTKTPFACHWFEIQFFYLGGFSRSLCLS